MREGVFAIGNILWSGRQWILFFAIAHQHPMLCRSDYCGLPVSWRRSFTARFQLQNGNQKQRERRTAESILHSTTWTTKVIDPWPLPQKCAHLPSNVPAVSGVIFKS